MATPPAAASSLAASEECVTTTRSAIVASNATGHHLLDIEGYSLTKKLLPTGKCTDSHRFRFGGRLWYICYYPNGWSSAHADFISIYLNLDEGGANPVTAEVTFSLLDQAGKPVPIAAGEHEYSSCGFGFHQFIKRAFLENSEHLKDDRFTIQCTITIKENLRAEERTVSLSPLVDVPPSDLHQHLRNLLITEEGADVTFRVAGETIRAHRYILATRSAVFRAELLGSVRESDASAIVEVCDMEAQLFRVLLQFVYTDALPEMTREEETVICQHLFVAADRYCINRLKLMCEDRLSRSIDVGSVTNILTLAEQHCCHRLKKACIRFLESPEALNAVLATDDFERLCRSCPSLFRELFFNMTKR